MLKKERRYDFKKELLQIHKKNIRNLSLSPLENEFEIKNGFSVILPENDDIVMLTAAKDFIDYLWTSMNISAMLSHTATDSNCIVITLNKSIEEASDYMGYRITVGEKLITLEGFDSKGIAQGLYFLEDLMNLRKAPFLEKKLTKSKALFTPRFAQSPMGMFDFSDESLSMMAHRGYDAIDLWINGLNITHRGDYIDMPLLCERAEKYGISVYIELYAVHSAHPDDEGSEEFYDKLYGSIFEACPKIKGVTLLGEANHFASRDPQAGRLGAANYIDNIPSGKRASGWVPCCDYPDFVKMVSKVVRKHRKDAEIIFSTYNWTGAPKEKRVALINALPTDITLMLAWDVYQGFEDNGIYEITCDYNLRIDGPSEHFICDAEAAKGRGIKIMTLANTAGRTWDFGVIPYEPMPYKWIKRFKNVLDAREKYGLTSLVECIHYGFHPSFINDLEKWAFFAHEESLEDMLKALLIRDFGTDNLSLVDDALKLWSEAMNHCIATAEAQYGVFRIGPSYPIWILPPGGPESGKIPTEFNAMFGNGIYREAYTPPFYDLQGPPRLRANLELKAVKEMADLFLEGINLLEKAQNPNDNLLYLINMGKFMYRTCITELHVVKTYLYLQKLASATDKSELDEYTDKIKEVLLAEKENVEQTIPVVQVDSRLGWEASMEYQGDEKCLRWKLRQLDYELNTSIPKIVEINAYGL